MSKLRAKDPLTTEPSKPKMVLYGPSGVGKTWFTLSFPNVYYIDTEGGAQRSHYMERLSKSGGRYMGPEDGACDFETVIEQFKALATEKHPYKTVVIDSITKVFTAAIVAEAERLDRDGKTNAFGVDKKPAVGFMQRLVKATNRLDMNVIFVSHEKAEWGADDKGERIEIGKTADCWPKLIYELDLAFHVQKRGKTRVAVARKSRLIGFPEGEHFDLSFDQFAERYGKDVIQKPTTPIALATPEQVSEVSRLVELLKIDQATQDKWLERANAETFSELNSEQADKVIAALNAKLK